MPYYPNLLHAAIPYPRDWHTRYPWNLVRFDHTKVIPLVLACNADSELLQGYCHGSGKQTVIKEVFKIEVIAVVYQSVDAVFSAYFASSFNTNTQASGLILSCFAESRDLLEIWYDLTNSEKKLIQEEGFSLEEALYPRWIDGLSS